MKRVISALLCFTLVFSIAACDSSSSKKHSKKNKKSKDHKSETYEKEKIVLDNIKSITIQNDGGFYVFDWDPIENATYYQILYDGQEYIRNGDWLEFSDCMPGDDLSFEVRAVYDDGDVTVHSEYSSFPFVVPEIDYTKYGFDRAAFLSLEQLKLWANTNGYTYECQDFPDTNQTALVIHFEDSLNKGLGNAVIRGFGGAVEGFFGGYEESIEDDFSSWESVLVNFTKSGSIKKFVADTNDNAKTGGVIGALTGAFDAMTMDTDIYISYLYDNDLLDHAPVYSTQTLLQNNRPNYADLFSSLQPTEEGYWYCYDNEQHKNMYYALAPIRIDGVDKWIVTIVPENLK